MMNHKGPVKARERLNLIGAALVLGVLVVLVSLPVDCSVLKDGILFPPVGYRSIGVPATFYGPIPPIEAVMQRIYDSSCRLLHVFVYGREDASKVLDGNTDNVATFLLSREGSVTIRYGNWNMDRTWTFLANGFYLLQTWAKAGSVWYVIVLEKILVLR